MDPQSVAFQPQNDLWRFQNELQRLQAVQAEHSDRLLRIERKHDDDARMKSVWAGASPFPNVLSGTPQQTPLHRPQSDAFKEFDDESANLIGSLHLDPEEEPRRIGATSRANSVRFDESANQGWAHTSRLSMDLMRSSGGLPMSERTSSHKSDGRASSAHSMRSVTSGRANSLNLDIGFSSGDSNRSPVDTPGLAPGLFLLGSVPAIIRCWMNNNFRHDALLYAAVCTGSHKSFLDRRLVDKLGFSDRINISTSGVQTIVLPMYFPEAVPHPTSTRSGSPAPQLPILTVTFNMLAAPLNDAADDKGIQIILGSDTLRIHNADILFSCNSLSLFDDDRTKISIPLVRPEDERTFSVLRTVSTPSTTHELPARTEDVSGGNAHINGLGQSSPSSTENMPALAGGTPIGSQRNATTGFSSSTSATTPAATAGGAAYSSEDDSTPATGRSIRFAQLPSQGAATAAASTEAAPGSTDPRTTPARTPTSPAIWSNWRQRAPTEPSSSSSPFSPSSTSPYTTTTTTTAAMDYASASKAKERAATKKDPSAGIRVLRPAKAAARSFSTTSMTANQASDGGKASRFFDEGRRREAGVQPQQQQGQEGGTESVDEKGRGAAGGGGGGGAAGQGQGQGPSSSSSSSLPRVNPAGGASAFSWLKQGGGGGGAGPFK